MLLYLFSDSGFSTCPKKIETEKRPQTADSPLYTESDCTLVKVLMCR